MVFLIAPTIIVLITSLTASESLRFPPPGLVAALVLRAARRRSDAARGLEQPGHRVLDHGDFGRAGHGRLDWPSRAASRNGFEAADLLFMSPLLLPALAFGFAALVYINKLGLSPSIPLLILGHVIVCVPFVLRTTIASLSQLDPALLDASQSLGGSQWMTFRRVTLPLIAPGLGAGAFLAFMASFDNVPVSLFLADERTEVLPIHLWQQIDTNLDVRTAAASGVIVIFTLVLMLIAERLAGFTRQMR